MGFPERLRELRNEMKLNQEELGSKINLSKANISKYETGRIQPNIETINYLAKFFNVSTDYLLGQTNVKNAYDNKDKVSKAVEDDPELKEFWDELQERETLQLMFKQVKDLDDKSIKQVIKIIKAIEDDEANE